MTISNMKYHLLHAHPEVKLVKAPTPSSSSSDTTVDEPALIYSRKRTARNSIHNIRSKKQKEELFLFTIPGYVQSKAPLPFHNARAQQIHKMIFEQMVMDLVPYHEVSVLHDVSLVTRPLFQDLAT